MTELKTTGENRLQREQYQALLQDAVRELLHRVGQENGGLGDWALLAYLELEAYVQTGKPYYRESASRVLGDILGEWSRNEWNGVTAAVLSKADRVLGEKKYQRAAQEAGKLLRSRLLAEEDQGDALAFTCWALLELYETDFDPANLREAMSLAVRLAETREGSQAAQCAAGLALLRLARLTGRERFRTLGEERLEWLDRETEEGAAAYGFALMVMLEERCPRQELICVSRRRIPGWLAGAGETYRLDVLARTEANREELAPLAPWTAELPAPETGEALYLCRDGVCAPAVRSVTELREMLLY